MQLPLFKKFIVYQILCYNSQQMDVITKKIWSSLLLIIFPSAFNSVGWNPPTPFHWTIRPSNAESFNFFSQEWFIRPDYENIKAI